jgi:hypothetical protein
LRFVKTKEPECQACWIARENREIDEVSADLWAEWDGNPGEDPREEEDDNGFNDVDTDPGPCTCGSLQLWLIGLRKLAADLDGMGEREERCAEPECGHLWETGPCQGTGIRLVPWNGAERVLLRAAIAAARLALPEWEEHHWDTCHSGDQDAYECCEAPRKAIKAAQRYLDERTLEAREAWLVATVGVHGTP